jgi:cation transport regulator ChaC
LADRLKKHGFKETKASIANKLARSTLTAAFFLGSNLEYLIRTNAGLSEHAIRDGLLERLVGLCSGAIPLEEASSA